MGLAIIYTIKHGPISKWLLVDSCKQNCVHIKWQASQSLIWSENLCPWPISIVCSGDGYWLLVCSGVLVCSGISMNRYINLYFNPKAQLVHVRGLNMDHLMPLRYVSFSYLSKVKSGGKVVHWTLTLIQVVYII